MNKLNKHRWGGVSVFSIAHDNILYVPLWHCHQMWLLHTQKSVYTQVCGDRAQISTTQGQTWLSVVHAAFCALHFELSLLAKLVPQKSSGALGKGRIFLNNCILCTCEMCGCIETIWKEMIRHPTAEGCPQGNKANQRHQSRAKQTSLWVLLGEYERSRQSKTCHGEQSVCS